MAKQQDETPKQQKENISEIIKDALRQYEEWLGKKYKSLNEKIKEFTRFEVTVENTFQEQQISKQSSSSGQQKGLEGGLRKAMEGQEGTVKRQDENPLYQGVNRQR